MILPPLPPGTRIGAWVVAGHLGAGRVADVYEVFVPGGPHRALKLLKPNISPGLKARARLAQEAESVATIDHVNVVGYFGGGEFDGRLYILVELVDGTDLARMAAAGRLPIPRLARLVRQVCEGVGAAHRRRIVHRDLKPENILVTRQDVAKVADFGSARFADWGVKTTSDQEVSTALYRAPEYMKDGEATAASDVFSIGVMLYELASGIHPLGLVRPNTFQVVSALVDYVPPKPLEELGLGIPGDLSALVQRAIAADPADRCSLLELRDGLEAVQQPFLADRRGHARNLPVPGRGLALAPTEPKIPAVGAHGTIPMPAVAGPPGRAATLPPEPDPRTLRSAEPKVTSPTVPMAAIALPVPDPSTDRRTTNIPVEQAPQRVSAAVREARARNGTMRAVAVGAAVIGLGIAGAGWILVGRAGEERSPASAPPPAPAPVSASPPAPSSSAPAPSSSAARPPPSPRKSPRLKGP